MGNVLTSIAPQAYSAAYKISQEPMGGLNAINLNFDDKGVAIGDTVNVPVAPVAATGTYTPAMTTTAGTDKTASNVQVEITANKETSWNLTGEQQRSLMNADTDKAWVEQLLSQGMRALRNDAEADLLDVIYKGASRASGTAGTAPFATDLTALTAARKILKDNGTPLVDPQLIVNTDASNNLGNLAVVQQADKAGTAEERRLGVFLKQYGFSIRESAQIASHTKGTATGFDCTAVEAIGETTIACDGSDSGTILAGDVVTTANAADSNIYVVNSGSTLTGSAAGNFIINAPGMRVPTVIADEWTIGANYTANVAFERGSVVGIMRPPVIPNSPVIQQLSISDTFGLTYLLCQIVGDGMITWRLHLAYGFKVVNTEHVALVMG